MPIELSATGSTVTISQEVWDEILARSVTAWGSLPKGGAEIGGLLAGTRSGSEVRIVNAAVLSCEYQSGPAYRLSERDMAAFQAAIAGVQAPNVSLGFFRSHTGIEDGLRPGDIALLDRLFPQQGAVAVLIRVLHVAACTAEIYGRVGAEWQKVASTGLLEPPGSPAADSALMVPPDARIAALLDPDEPSGRRWWPALVTAAVMAAGGVGGYFAMARRNAPAPTAPAAVQTAAEPAVPLGLAVAMSPDGLAVQWNRDIRPAAHALEAVLIIRDGEVRRELPFNAEEFRTRKVVYRPVGGEVSFQLRLTTDDGRRHEESVVVLGAPASPGKRVPEWAARPVPAVPAVPPQVSESAASREMIEEQPDPHPTAAALTLPAPIRAENSTQPPAPPPVMRPPVAQAAPPRVEPAAVRQAPVQSAPVQPPLAKSSPVQPAAIPTSRPAPNQAAPVQSAPAQAAPVQPPAPQPAPARSDFVPARFIQRVEPSLPDRHPFLRAADLVVRVKVTIDESGRVIRTDALSRTTANGLLVESAMQAARQSRFEPARTHGQAVRSEMIVVYQFRPR